MIPPEPEPVGPEISFLSPALEPYGSGLTAYDTMVVDGVQYNVQLTYVFDGSDGTGMGVFLVDGDSSSPIGVAYVENYRTQYTYLFNGVSSDKGDYGSITSIVTKRLDGGATVDIPDVTDKLGTTTEFVIS